MAKHKLTWPVFSLSLCTSSSQPLSFFLHFLTCAQTNLDLNLAWRTNFHGLFLVLGMTLHIS